MHAEVCRPSAIVVDGRCFESFVPALSIANTCGFVVIKPELGLVLAKDAIKTAVYLG